MNRNLSLSAFVFAVAVAGCAGPTSYKPTKLPELDAVTADQFTETTLMPSKVGDTWSYDFETVTQSKKGSNREAGSMKFIVDSVKDSPAGKLLSMSVTKDGQTVDKQVWQLSAKGIYQLTAGINNLPFTPSQPLLMLPIKGNEKFSWKGKGTCPDGYPGTMRVETEVRGVEPIDTSSGKSNALAVESNTAFQSSKLKALLGITTWYKPNVGIVRLKQALVAPGGNIVTTLKLVSGPK